MDKGLPKMPKMVNFWRLFENLKLAVTKCYQTGHFKRTKINGNAKIEKLKCYIFSNFQTVLPDRSLLKGQKLLENAKIEKLKCDILSNFETM